MPEHVERLEAFPLSLPRDTPYLGPLPPEAAGIPNGYFIRPGNRSVYSRADHSVLVKATSTGGAAGWGECVTVVAPGAVVEILRDLVFPLALGRDPHDVCAIYDDLYGAMRVRGFFGGFYHDSLAALDIALWDLKARLCGLPLAKLLGGGRRAAIPAYVSGLPAATLAERVEMAAAWKDRGFHAVKFAAAVANEGEEAEMKALRGALGPGVKIMADLHWRYTAPEAIRLITRLEAYDLALAEAPVAPEDIGALAQVAAAVKTPIACGEEYRTVYDFVPRLERRAIGVMQPEIGRTGITSFLRIAHLAQAYNVPVMPHASIGIGVFQSASLHAAATLPDVPYHEYQHSIFDKNLRYVDTGMRCERGFFHLPEGPGLGTSPTEELLAAAVR